MSKALKSELIKMSIHNISSDAKKYWNATSPSRPPTTPPLPAKCQTMLHFLGNPQKIHMLYMQSTLFPWILCPLYTICYFCRKNSCLHDWMNEWINGWTGLLVWFIFIVGLVGIHLCTCFFFHIPAHFFQWIRFNGVLSLFFVCC